MQGTFFSLGTDSGAVVLQCYLRVCVCVVWSVDAVSGRQTASESYRWARNTWSKKQAKATIAFDSHRGTDPAFTPGQDKSALLLQKMCTNVGFL